MRTAISFTLKLADRRRLKVLARDRNAPHKHVWRAEIVLLSADGTGTNEIMRRTGKSKTCVWRWQERFMKEGIDGLLHDKTRPSRIPPLGPEVAARVVALTLADPPVETTHWTADLMARASGFSGTVIGNSSSRTIRTSSTSYATWSGSMSIRRPTPSCCRSTRRAKSRLSIAPSRACR